MLANAPDPKRWWALFLLSAAQFIVILDTSIIGVALPAIQTDLHFSAANLQWIFNAYVVIFGGLLLLGGRLADLFGQRRIHEILQIRIGRVGLRRQTGLPAAFLRKSRPAGVGNPDLQGPQPAE